MNRVINIKSSFDPVADHGDVLADLSFFARGTPVKGEDCGVVYKHGPMTCKRCKRRNSATRRYRGASASARSKFQKLLLASSSSDDIYGGLNFSVPTIVAESPIEAAVAVAQPAHAHAHNIETVRVPMRAETASAPATPQPKPSSVPSSAMPGVSASVRRKASHASKALAAVQELTAAAPMASSISSTSIMSSTPATLLSSFFRTRSS